MLAVMPVKSGLRSYGGLPMSHCASVIVDLGNTSRASFIATLAMVMSISFCLAMVMSISFCHATSADSGSITSTTMEKSSRRRSCMPTVSHIPSSWIRESMYTISRGLASYIYLKVSSERKEMSISMRKMVKKSLVRNSQT